MRRVLCASSLVISLEPTAATITFSHSSSFRSPNVTSTIFSHNSPSAPTSLPACKSFSHGASTRFLPPLRVPARAAWHVSTHSSDSAWVALPSRRLMCPRYNIPRCRMCSDRRPAMRLYNAVTVVWGRFVRRNVRCEERSAMGPRRVCETAKSSAGAAFGLGLQYVVYQLLKRRSNYRY